MEREEFGSELDNILNEAFTKPPDYLIPESFTDDLVRKLERKLAWKELLSEFGIKVALVLAALAVLLICLIFPAKSNLLPWLAWMAGNRFLIASGVGILLFITLIDQVVLKFMIRKL